MAAVICFFVSLFFIRSLVVGHLAAGWISIVIELLQAPGHHLLAGLLGFCCGTLSQFRHGYRRGILPLAALVATFGLSDVMVLSHEISSIQFSAVGDANP